MPVTLTAAKPGLVRVITVSLRKTWPPIAFEAAEVFGLSMLVKTSRSSAAASSSPAMVSALPVPTGVMPETTNMLSL